MYYSLCSPDLLLHTFFYFQLLIVVAKTVLSPTKVLMEAFTCDALNNRIY
jgi:hypothetical protein